MPIPRQYFTARLLIIVSIIVLPILIFDLINFSVDDVFIPLRIAQNLVNGNGMVYNAGEYVEGHSDPIWVLALTGLMMILPAYSDPMYMLWVAKIMSAVFGLGTIALTYLVVQKIFKGNARASLYSSISVFLLATSGFFMAWSVSGMETTMASFLYVMAVFIVANPLRENHQGRGSHQSDISRRAHVGLSGILFIAALCRPEAPLFFGFIYSYLLIVSSRKLNTVLFGVLPYIIMMSVFITWRYSVYSDVFPNTYYAKTGMSFASVIVGIKHTMESIAGLLGPMFILLPVSFFSKRSRTDPFWLFLGLTVFNALFVVYAGGDWMPGFRLMLPMLPMMIIVCLFNIDLILTKINFHVGKTNRRRLIAVISTAAFIAAGVLFISRATLRGQSIYMLSGFASITGTPNTEHLLVANWIKQHTHPGTLVAAGEAGLIGFLNPDMKLLDINGLMDKKIAHDRKNLRPFDLDYIFSREPDFIILFKHIFNPISAFGNQNEYDAIFKYPRFEELYEIEAAYMRFTIYSRKKQTD